LKSNVFRTFRAICLFGLASPSVFAQSVPAASPHPEPTAQSKTLTRETVAGYIAADQKIVTPHGIEEIIPVKINGITQWLSIRGKDTRNPVLLYLHGGPGLAFLPLAWTVARPWEDYFTVVQWDQRGAGKTYAANDPAIVGPTMTIPQMTSDAAEVVRYLQGHLHKQKIFLVGHSWGSILGVALAQQYPDWFYAYVGVGQYVNSRRSEEAGYRFALEQARLHKNVEAEKELLAIAPYPGDLDKLSFQQIGTERKWLTFFGGVTAYRSDQSFEEGVGELSPAYSQHELDASDDAAMFNVTHLLRPMLHVDYTAITDFKCPVFIFAGRHDYATSHDLAYNWFARLKAPGKTFIWFENSGHLIPEEEPGRFFYHLVADVRPLAVEVGDAPSPDVMVKGNGDN
jgi:pimeloyl-ACP methyl ester carboxylesterase